MSTVADAGAVTNQYFCYQCNCTVNIATQSSSSELICPNCNGGFLEEFESSNPNNNAHDHLSNLLFPISSEISDFSSLLRGGRFDNREEFDPLSFFVTYLNTLRAGGANIQFVVNNSNRDRINFDNNDGAVNFSDPLGLRIPLNLGDYVVGPGLEQLIQQLSENDPNRHGPPPAAKSAVEGLKCVEIREDRSDCDFSQCAVCMDSFEAGEIAKEMPCKHLFHSDCISPWLEMHNSCPVCRFELPTDDEDYENRKRGGGVESSGGGIGQSSGGGMAQLSGARTMALGIGGSLGNAYNNAYNNPRMMERRFRIQLPMLIRSGGETSNTGPGNSGAGNDNNAGGSNTDTQATDDVD